MNFTPETPTRSWRTLAGPADREHFLDAQARNRRTAWRLTALCVLGVVLMGIPMSVVVTPLVIAAAVVLYDLVALVLPTGELSGLVGSEPAASSAGFTDLQAGAILAVALIGPGALAMGVAWLGTRSLFVRAGSDALVRALGGRPPRADDLEEQQLGNVVTEIAIAAGVPPPRLALIDGPVANAAALGSSHEDAVVLVSRRLLDELDRDETQGVVAHLIGAIGNGDLRVALSMLSLSRTIALLMAALGATFGPDSRRALARVARLAWRPRASSGREDELADIDALLASAADTHDREIDRLHRKKTTIADIVRAPFLMAHFAIWLSRLAFMSFVVAPLLALLWRSRRYLADSSAVQLTRNPDAVARALASLSAKGGVVPGAGWAAPLFIIGPRSGPGGAFGGGAAKSGVVGDDFGLLSFDPPIRARMARLRRQGASVDLASMPRRSSPALLAFLTAIAVVLGTVLMGCALAITGVALAFDMLILSPIVALVHVVLRVWLA